MEHHPSHDPSPVQVQAGGEHTLVLDRRHGSIFSAGACGLGWCRLHPVTEALFHFRKVHHMRHVDGVKSSPSRPSNATATAATTTTTPTTKTTPTTTSTEPFKMMHASYYHNLAVGAQSGMLYSWGCGTFTEDSGVMDGVIPALGQVPSKDGPPITDRGQGPTTVPLAHDGHNPADTNAADSIVAISGGAYHSIVLQASGRVLTFGAGQLGQLGRKIVRDCTMDGTGDASGLPVDPAPTSVEGLPSPHEDPVTGVGAGFYNTFAVCRSGALYCAGENQNQQCGAMRNGARNLMKMTRVEEFGAEVLHGGDDKGMAQGGGDRIDQVEGGYCHTLIKTLRGKLFSLGCGDDGQRGDGMLSLDADDDDDGNNEEGTVVHESSHPPNPAHDTTVARPVVSRIKLPNDELVAKIAAGANHSVVLTTNGNVFAFGANDVGQCGVTARPHVSTTQTNSDGDDGDDDEDGSDQMDNISVPTRVPLPTQDIVDVSAGYAHSVVTVGTGDVYVFGQNDNGQLGIGRSDVESMAEPTKLNGLHRCSE